MAIIRRKVVAVPKDVWGAFSTSRTAQWGGIILIILLAVALNIWIRMNSERAKAETDKMAVESVYRFPSYALPPETVVVGIDPGTATPQLRDALLGGLRSRLSEGTGIPLSADVFLPPFYATRFGEAFSGDTAFLERTGFFGKAKAVLLIRPHFEFTDSQLGNGLKACRLTLSARRISSGEPPRQSEISSVATGLSDDASLKKAIASLDAVQLQALAK